MLRLNTLRQAATVAPRMQLAGQSATVGLRFAHGHGKETYETFNDRYADFFANAQDVFEVQRGLNNCFAADLVPNLRVVEEAVRAARRVNDYSTAVRIFEGIKAKTESEAQYKQYLEETETLRKELGIVLKEELYP